jgi:hypothetical protein
VASRRSAALVALALACACGGSYYASGPGAATPDGLRRVRFSPLDAEYLRPGASLRSYTGVIVEPATVTWRPQQGSRLDPLATEFVPTPELVAVIGEEYHGALVDGLVAGGAFALVTEPGWGVLRVRGQIVDHALSADPKGQASGRVDSYPKAFGALTLVLDVSDARTGESLLRSVARGPIGGGASHPARDTGFASMRVVPSNTPAVQATAYRELFNHQAIVLRQQLEELRRRPAPGVE